MRWKTITLPMEAMENDPYGRKQGTLLWENHYSAEEVDELKRDPSIWQALYQQSPATMDGLWFNEEWITDDHFVDLGKLPLDKLNKYILVDPALSTKSGGNYTAMMTVGLGEDNNYYILNMFRDKIDPYQRTDALFRLVRRWKPIRVGYEQYGLVADIPYMKEQMEKKNFRFQIQELGKTGPQHNLSKRDRIRQLIPTFREGRIYFPKQQLFTDAKHNVIDLVQAFFEQEYNHYPSSKYDDMLDCLARIHDPMMKWEWPVGEAEYEETLPAGEGGSWLTG